MKVNVYDVSKTIVLAGTCLERMHPKAYKKLTKISNDILEVCLEETHINMALSKLLSIICRVKPQKIIIATVDKSMHCTGLHYLESEISKIMDTSFTEFIHYVADGDYLVQFSSDTIRLSKNLIELQKING